MPHAAVNGISICYQSSILVDEASQPTASAAPPDVPTLLLVMGLGAQMIAWPPQLLEPLTTAGIRLVWYDNRDVGESTWLEDHPTTGLQDLLTGVTMGSLPPPPYTLTDMAADGMALLDHLGIRTAHVLGVSMGGMIAQRMAVGWPDRVRSLTSVMSTTGARGLPGPTPEAAQALFAPTPTEREAYIASTRTTRDVIGSPGFVQDDAWLQGTIGEGYDRGVNAAGFLRQYHAILADGDRTAALAQVLAPTMVVHGADDPLVPLAAGRATAEAIPGAILHTIDGMGHDLPPGVCARIVEQLLPRLV